jgi:HAD superfamily hydrolase (TIGR01549 family)
VIDIVFFDAGETLVHPHPSFPEVFAEISKDSDHPVPAEEVARVQARLAPHLVDIAEETGVENPTFSEKESRTFWSYLYRRFLQELGIEDEALVEKLYGRFSSTTTYKLFEDALPSLRAIGAAGFRVGLISNFEGWLEEMLVELEVGHLFDVKVISGVEGVEKPDPGIYRLALERAGTEARQAVHVGDSPGLDVEPSVEVGMTAVLLDRFDRYSHIDVPRIESLEELAPLVAKL